MSAITKKEQENDLGAQGATAVDAACPSVPAWLPIASAPMDGTEILLTTITHGQYGHIEHGSWGFIEVSDWDGMKSYGWLSDYGNIEEPTHWMPALPLPEPPQ